MYHWRFPLQAGRIITPECNELQTEREVKYQSLRNSIVEIYFAEIKPNVTV